MNNDVHSEGKRDACDGASDVPKTNQAEGKSGEFVERLVAIAEIFTARPVAATHGITLMADVRDEFEQQAEGMLSYCVGRVGRNVRNRNSSIASGGQINNVR